MVSESCSTLAEETWSLVVVAAVAVILAVFAAAAVGLAAADFGSSFGLASPPKTPTR